MKFAALLAAVLLCTAVSAEAQARDLRHPAASTPAFTVQIPDDWTHEVDPDNNLLVYSRDNATSVVFTFGDFTGPLEDAAAQMLELAKATPPTGKAAASISGLPGFSFDSTMNPGGQRVLLKMAIVRPRPNGFASATKIEREGNTAQQRELANTVMRSVRIIGGQQ